MKPLQQDRSTVTQRWRSALAAGARRAPQVTATSGSVANRSTWEQQFYGHDRPNGHIILNDNGRPWACIVRGI